MFTGLFSYLSKTEAVPTVTVPAAVNYVTPKTGVQYRGSCQLINGRAEIDMGQIMQNPANIQIFYNNITNWDLIRIEDKNTLTTGKFVIISQNLESIATVDWLVIFERSVVVSIPEIKIIEPEEKKAMPMSALHMELVQRLNRRALENKVSDPIPAFDTSVKSKSKKKEKTDFRKELLVKKQAIMNKRKLERK